MRMFLVGMCDIFLLLYLTALSQMEQRPVSPLTVGDYRVLEQSRDELEQRRMQAQQEAARRQAEVEELKKKLAEIDEEHRALAGREHEANALRAAAEGEAAALRGKITGLEQQTALRADLERRLRELEQRREQERAETEKQFGERERLAEEMRRTAEEERRRAEETTAAADQARREAEAAGAQAAAAQQAREEAARRAEQARQAQEEALQQAREASAAEQQAAVMRQRSAAEAEAARLAAQAAKKEMDEARRSAEEQQRLREQAEQQAREAMEEAAAARAEAEQSAKSAAAARLDAQLEKTRARVSAAQANELREQAETEAREAIVAARQADEQRAAARREVQIMTQSAKKAYEQNIKSNALRIEIVVREKGMFGTGEESSSLNALVVDYNGTSAVVLPVSATSLQEIDNPDDVEAIRITAGSSPVREMYLSPTRPLLAAMVVEGVEKGAEPVPAGPPGRYMPVLIDFRTGAARGFSDRLRELSHDYFVFNRDRLKAGPGAKLTYQASGIRGTGDYGERLLPADQIADLEGKFIGVVAGDGTIVPVPEISRWMRVDLTRPRQAAAQIKRGLR